MKKPTMTNAMVGCNGWALTIYQTVIGSAATMDWPALQLKA